MLLIFIIIIIIILYIIFLSVSECRSYVFCNRQSNKVRCLYDWSISDSWWVEVCLELNYAFIYLLNSGVFLQEGFLWLWRGGHFSDPVGNLLFSPLKIIKSQTFRWDISVFRRGSPPPGGIQHCSLTHLKWTKYCKMYFFFWVHRF